MNNSAQQLDKLLSETTADAQARRKKEFAWFDKNSDALALYGAGTLGRAVLNKLRKLGIEPVAFADDTPEKQGQTINGVPVMTPGKVVQQFGQDTTFVVTILNPQLSFLEAKKKLQSASAQKVISFLSIAWRYPETFLPYYQFETPEQLLTKGQEIRRAFDLWTDEESRRQYVAQLQFRLHLDYKSLPANSHQGYFPDFLPKLSGDTVFVDCGAFDGDSIRDFLKLQNSSFARVYAFEPDGLNFAQLEKFVTTLDPDLSSKINFYNAAVGQTRTRVAFNATGNMSASLATNGEQTVDLVTLDEVVDASTGDVFLKLDVEGAELEVLNGAERLLREAKPIIAISIYHRPDDLWSLPLLLHSFDSNYSYFLRTQGEDGMDVICYAVPKYLFQ